ncbi:MAG: hypothetical protein V2A58_10165 [Planctomycetota bacterium]
MAWYTEGKGFPTPHHWQTLYDRDRARKRNAFTLNSDGNLVAQLKLARGMHRFLFEVDRGTFDADMMFFNVYGVRVGPSTQFFRVPGFSDATEKTRYLNETWVGPMLDVYQDRNYIGSALTEFPSHKEFSRGYHFGEFALEFAGREHDVRLVNGRGYRLGFRRVLVRRDERPPRYHVELRRSLRGKHPRLHFGSREELRTWAKDRSPRRWRQFRRTVEKRLCELRDGIQTDAADVLPFALTYLVTGTRRYFDIARGAMQHLLTEEMPGPENGKRMYRGYQYVEPGRLVEITSCFYDWCYHEIEPAWRDMIRESVARVMRWWMPFIKFMTLEWPGNPGGMCHSAYNYHAVGIAGLAFHGEVAEAGEWLDWAVRHFDIAKQRTARDGSSGLFPHEHCYPAYWDFAVALAHGTGINQLTGWRFFENLPAHRIALETSAMEQMGSAHPDYSPNFLAWEALAALTGNPKAQWLAERYMTKALIPTCCGLAHGQNSPLTAFMRRFLFHAPEVPAEAGFNDMHLDQRFADTGQVISRSGWLADDETLAFLWSGTERGRVVQDLEHRVSVTDYPAANSVTVNAYGEGLVAIPPVGYNLRTANFSTLTIEDEGQIEEGTVFGCRKGPSQVGRIVGFHSADTFAYAAGEAAQCYEPEAGLEQFTRHMIHVKGGLVAVFDEIRLSRPRSAAIHWGFSIADPTVKFRKRRKHRLNLLDGHTAFFYGHTAGLAVRVPQAMRQEMSIVPVVIPRGYDDLDSVFSRVTVAARESRSHRFLTLLVPVPGRTVKRLSDVKETSCSSAVVCTVAKADSETVIVMPKGRGAVRINDIRFAGRLLLAHKRAGECIAVCALGAREIEISGVRKVKLDARSNVFAERFRDRWQMKKETCK